MDPECAAILQQMRNAYAYPSASVRMLAPGEEAESFSVEDVRFAFVSAGPGEFTNLQLDSGFSESLRSPERWQRRRGLLSVLYWGFYTFGDTYARGRVQRLVGPSNPAWHGIGDLETLEQLDEATRLLDLNDFGGAIAALSDISQFGRTPFASKVIAFLRPESAGVYDNKIGEWLEGSRPLTNPRLEECLFSHFNRQLLCGGVGEVESIKIQYKYAAWCWFLQDCARRLNALGAGFQWTDPFQGPHHWRALDVERAIYHALGP